MVIEVHHIGKIFKSGEETVETFLEKRGYRSLGNLHINQVFVKNDFVEQKLEKPFVQYFKDAL